MVPSTGSIATAVTIMARHAKPPCWLHFHLRKSTLVERDRAAAHFQGRHLPARFVSFGCASPISRWRAEPNLPHGDTIGLARMPFPSREVLDSHPVTESHRRGCYKGFLPVQFGQCDGPGRILGARYVQHVG